MVVRIRELQTLNSPRMWAIEVCETLTAQFAVYRCIRGSMDDAQRCADNLVSDGLDTLVAALACD